jgi:hypothetical protein
MVDLPEWRAFDANAPPVLPEHAERSGRLVVVVATDSVREQGWALEATCSVAESWSQAGHKVVLADAGLAEATLHEHVGSDNAEGVSDTVLFGSSVRRVAKRTEEGTYFFITAGTAPADPADVLASERWRRLCAGFVDAGVTLISFIGADAAGKAALLNLATDVIILAAAPEDPWPAVDGTLAPIRAVLGPASTAPGDSLPQDDEADVFDPLVSMVAEGAKDASEASDQEDFASDSGSDSGEAPSGASAAPSEEGEASDAVLPEAEATIVEAAGHPPAAVATKSNRRLGLLVVVLALMIVGADEMGMVDIPWPWMAPESTDGELDAGAVSQAPPPPIVSTNPTLAYSVTVGAYQDADVAETRANSVSSAQGVLVAVAPIMVDGTLFHRVLVGPATDSASAESLADRVAAETGADRSTWVMRETPVAFDLGVYAELDAATRRIEVLVGLDVPAYVLAMDMSDGSTRYRIYAGAYANEQEATYLRGHLEAQGLNDPTLSTRVGRIP